ncbi:FitA-like ribbon-helix-helix domain-containing protein [Wenzhouxiangella sp. EGI_FJ10305]|uniref:FitA-like ribbon-helix-helix domain-containing protein n=1 Tax=Wenzhouxiangella sp. EGI_FJ10305 TaxID=3243768 RepID=UPI0035D916A9
MAQFVVRNLDEDLKAALKRRAAANGCSMEEEVRRILRRAVTEQPAASTGLGSRMAARFSDAGLDEPLPEMRGQEIDPIDMPE